MKWDQNLEKTLYYLQHLFKTPLNLSMYLSIYSTRYIKLFKQLELTLIIYHCKQLVCLEEEFLGLHLHETYSFQFFFQYINFCCMDFAPPDI